MSWPSRSPFWRVCRPEAACESLRQAPLCGKGRGLEPDTGWKPARPPVCPKVCWYRVSVASGQKLDGAQNARHSFLVARPELPQSRTSRRDRRKQETIDDIKAAARGQLAGGGPAGISLRAIARELGMTASAVHYYFPS